METKVVGMVWDVVSQLSMKEDLSRTNAKSLNWGVMMLKYCTSGTVISKDPLMVLPSMICFAVFTASSTRPFD